MKRWSSPDLGLVSNAVSIAIRLTRARPTLAFGFPEKPCRLDGEKVFFVLEDGPVARFSRTPLGSGKLLFRHRVQARST